MKFKDSVVFIFMNFVIVHLFLTNELYLNGSSHSVCLHSDIGKSNFFITFFSIFDESNEGFSLLALEWM